MTQAHSLQWCLKWVVVRAKDNLLVRAGSAQLSLRYSINAVALKAVQKSLPVRTMRNP